MNIVDDATLLRIGSKLYNFAPRCKICTQLPPVKVAQLTVELMFVLKPFSVLVEEYSAFLPTGEARIYDATLIRHKRHCNAVSTLTTEEKDILGISITLDETLSKLYNSRFNTNFVSDSIREEICRCRVNNLFMLNESVEKYTEDLNLLEKGLLPKHMQQMYSGSTPKPADFSLLTLMARARRDDAVEKKEKVASSIHTALIAQSKSDSVKNVFITKIENNLDILYSNVNQFTEDFIMFLKEELKDDPDKLRKIADFYVKGIENKIVVGTDGLKLLSEKKEISNG